MDAIAQFKEVQKQGWGSFTPFEMITGRAAARLVDFAKLQRGTKVLDVACGTGVVAITAARAGCKVTGLDLSPKLLERARENATLAGVEITWHEGDAEALPFEDGAFDVVLSQFGHMFAPRPDVATKELLRVLKPGGTLAFATWPPDLFTGRMFALTGRYLPPPPEGVSPPPQWGAPAIVRERLGDAVKDLTFNTGTMYAPALSPAHLRDMMEKNVAPVMKLVQTYGPTNDPKLGEFRRELDALTSLYFEDNAVRQDFLLTRAIKR